MDEKLRTGPGEQNEGEGSKSADKKYREAATDFAQRTDTLEAGREAEREVENYKDEFDRALSAGRAHSAGDLRKDVTGEAFRKKP